MTENITMRLAFRMEGDYWNAYCALPDSMRDAILLGSISGNIAVENPAIKQGFMDLMTTAYSDLVLSLTGARPEAVELRRAPEHERSGRA